MVKLDIDFSRRNIGIDAYIWNKYKNKFEKLDALFDTGAHTCAIDTEVFLNLGYNLNDATKSFITTATKHGEKAHRVRIDKIMLDDTEINSVMFNTFEFPLTSHPVVLGMNIIRHFEVNMNFKEKLITMRENYMDDEDNYYDEKIFGDWRTDIV